MNNETNTAQALADSKIYQDYERAFSETTGLPIAFRIFPDYAEAYNNLGNVLLSQGRITEAIERFEPVIAAAPDNASAQNNLGSARARLGQTAVAAVHFKEAIRLKPDYLEAHFNLGSAYLAQNRAEAAIAEFATALSLKPDFEPAQRGIVRAQQKRAAGRPQN
jgi:tetratricopeptide (TPR) repeat protein